MNNQVNLCGHVGKAPVVTTFEDTGNKVAKFSIAVKMYSSKTDEPRKIWVDIDSWNGLAERVEKYVTKGREVVISGRLDISSYTKTIQGVDVTVTKPVIKLSSFHLCGPKPQSSNGSQNEELSEAESEQELVTA